MKRFAFYLGFATALVASCSIQEEDFNTPPLDDVIFYASFEQPADEGTRVYANENLYLRWTADDRVSIFNKITYNQEYKFLGETGDNAGGFNRVDNAEFVTGNPISHVVSVYPYQASTKISEDEIITLTLPAEQHYAENTFGLGDNTMVSVSADNVLQYKNVGGYLRISLYGEGVSVSSITLKGNNGEKLAGKASVTMPLDGPPSVVLADDATDEIALVCDTPVCLGATEDESTDFWFVVTPVAFSKGFTIYVTQLTGGVFERKTNKSITIERNNLSKMAPMEVDMITPSGIIEFADENVKDKLVAAFDSDRDGNISYAEAAAVTSIDGVFGDETDFTSFDEFQYFTSVKNLSRSQFENWTLLSTIALPISLETIGDSAFRRCENLKTINLPNNLKILGNSVFYQCSKLQEINIPNTVMSMGYNVFRDCTNLESANIPVSLTSISEGLFYNCTKLSNIIIPDGITTIESTAFSGCSSLTAIDIPNSVTTIGLASFANCSNLVDVHISESLTRIEEWCFIHCKSIAAITIPPSVLSIGKQAFYGCRALAEVFVLSSNPPLGQEEMFYQYDSQMTIYVPATAVDAYRIADYWNEYADRIQAIPSSSVPVPEAIDLGLPSGLKWASFNLGASKPEEYGNYYAWGETEPKQDYSWETYKWCKGSYITLTKYCSSSSYGYNGFTDTKTSLDSEDNAVHVLLGGKWRMPSKEEYSELTRQCTWVWTQMNGVNGRKFTGPNGNSIFLPAAGRRLHTDLRGDGSSGTYWSSSIDAGAPEQGYSFRIDETGIIEWFTDERCFGLSIRPVCN